MDLDLSDTKRIVYSASSLILSISSFLDYRDILQCTQINKIWHKALSVDSFGTESIWQTLFARHFCDPSFVDRVDDTSWRVLFKHALLRVGAPQHYFISQDNLPSFSDSKLPDPPTCQCVVLGDFGVGQTAFIFRACSREFPDYREGNYIYRYDPFERRWRWQNRVCLLELYETPGKDEHDGLRSCAYPDQVDFVFILFSFVHRKSFERVVTKWKPEISRVSPTAHVILVGTQVDYKIRDVARLMPVPPLIEEHVPLSPPEQWVTLDEALATAHQIGALALFQCSSWTNVGITPIFDFLLRAHLAKSMSIPFLPRPAPKPPVVLPSNSQDINGKNKCSIQ
eukprot:TRINITY_DN2515_c0_g1_i4.p1 TRINITY_DN2515_c0_g1~~TRINITY_DN2515_c0_g1_i4.p1  ORF type:complete len:362 (-),score=33.24 TRINITY_DN2515_c0_g1_i4:12-1031(-)